MALSQVSLTASARNNLLALQNTASLLQTTQNALATGKKVNNAIDNATAYFASQGFLNRANDLSNLKDNLSTAVQTVTSVGQSITDVQNVVSELQGLATSALQTTDTTSRAGLASQFNALRTQLDLLVNDATFNGTNLLNSTGNQLVVYFNETNTTSLTITGVNITSAGLTINAAQNAFATTADINTSASLLLTALTTLRTDASTFGTNATLIQTRQDFTNNLINSLQTASDNLVLADINQQGANLQALQAQDQLGIVSLGISGQLQNAILRLFP
ncbi:MAG TPA: flagellin [Alphaproteobacteria bacterium]|nr:flagellin [Alphaproteobacteria bacterium]